MPDKDPVFRLPVYRRFSDLDPLGHVNNVVFYDYLQEARVQMLTRLGHLDISTLAQVVVKQEMTYRKPLLLKPEPIVIETWIGHVGNSSYSVRYRILDEVGDLAAEAMTLLANVALETGRPIRLDAELRALLQALTIPE
jgi:acyl-CoA thioester hydrolase